MEALSREFKVALPCELLYADDLVVMAETEDDLIKRLNEWKNNMENRGMTENMNKSNGKMHHVCSGLNTASDGRALCDLDLAVATQQPRPLALATLWASMADAEAAAMQQPCRPLARPTVRQQPGHGGSTVGLYSSLLVLHFVIEFANIWAQYCPSTYASTHIGFFGFVP